MYLPAPVVYHLRDMLETSSINKEKLYLLGAPFKWLTGWNRLKMRGTEECGGKTGSLETLERLSTENGGETPSDVIQTRVASAERLMLWQCFVQRGATGTRRLSCRGLSIGSKPQHSLLR
jgi:hypothetical protein